MADTNSKLKDLTNGLYERERTYGMEVSTEKSTIMVNRTTNNSADINMNCKKLE
ncbi:hypothetical protein DPMN_168545 [Dreissena polymorpha]|uniref:Uncharacterized protein n=1 Tax=Dreissena polymorpha TaxID=45954 RepID=A0A9D4F201_DREPO|nr:hypothetical protein DPMN_168545 [Dreissena polymorpha]